jgi:hypothetical protein
MSNGDGPVESSNGGGSGAPAVPVVGTGVGPGAVGVTGWGYGGETDHPAFGVFGWAIDGIGVGGQMPGAGGAAIAGWAGEIPQAIEGGPPPAMAFPAGDVVGVYGHVGGEFRPSQSTLQCAVWGDAANSAGVTGVLGTSSDGTAVHGIAGSGRGVLGASDGSDGVYGQTKGDGKSGVAGDDTSKAGGHGVFGGSDNGDGVHGQTKGDGKSGVAGDDTSKAGGHGVFGGSDNGVGVYGQTAASDQSGVLGVANSSSGGSGVKGTSKAGSGVYGETAAGGLQAGVYGSNTGGGIGVLGTSSGSTGTGIMAISETGIALNVLGTAQFAASGIVTVPAGISDITVENGLVSPTSLILATLQQVDGAVHVKAAVPASGSLTIYLSAAAAAAAPVAWFAIG